MHSVDFTNQQNQLTSSQYVGKDSWFLKSLLKDGSVLRICLPLRNSVRVRK